MSRWLEILLRDVDGLPARLLEGLRAIREMDGRTRQLSLDIARDETALMDELKRLLRAKEQLRAEKRNKKAKEVARGGHASGADDAEGMPSAEPRLDDAPGAESQVEPAKELSEFTFIEEVYQARKEELARRRQELTALMEQQLRLSSDLYFALDDKVNHMTCALNTADSSSSGAAGSEAPQRKRRAVLSEAEVFEAGIEAAMRERKDPNEPLYCTCRRLSFGDMIACDNEDCPVEWFHYLCVGIAAPPSSWLCPQCSAAQSSTQTHSETGLKKQ